MKLTGQVLFVFMGLSVVSGCVSNSTVNTVNTATISSSQASAKAFSKAKRAVQACSGLPNSKKMFDSFEAIGYRSTLAPDFASRTELPGGKTRVVVPNVRYNDGELIVQAGLDYCYVGLRGMTPAQSYQLALPLVQRYGATTNEENGQGLSARVVQAWRVQDHGTPSVLIAAHKTWPRDRGTWPSEPGSAVTLFAR